MNSNSHGNNTGFTHCIVLGTLAISLAFAPIAPSARAGPITVPPGYAVEQIPTGAFPLVQSDGLAVAKDSSIYISRNFFSGQSDLLKISPSGDVSEIASFGAFNGGLAINSMGQLFGSLFNQTIFKYENGVVSTFATGLPKLSAEKMAFDTQNNLYVAYFNAGEILRLSPTGVPSIFVSGLGGPFGVTFRNGLLFVGDNLGRGNGPGVIDQIGHSGEIVNTIGPIPGRIVDLKYDSSPGLEGFFIANQGDALGGEDLRESTV